MAIRDDMTCRSNEEGNEDNKSPHLRAFDNEKTTTGPENRFGKEAVMSFVAGIHLG